MDLTLTLFLAIFSAVFIANILTTILGVALNAVLMKQQQRRMTMEFNRRNPAIPKDPTS